MFTTEERKEIATTILMQLGGNKFKAMTGAKDILFLEDGGLRFRMPRTPFKKITHVQINYDSARDLYTIQFFRENSRQFTITTISKHQHVYADDLPRIFTEVTGLDTHL